MKNLNKYLFFVGIVAITALSSCKDDPSDCGFPAVIEARENFLAANQAISNASVPGAGGPTVEQCAALDKAIEDFEIAVFNLEENCLREVDKANLVTWTIDVASTVTC